MNKSKHNPGGKTKILDDRDEQLLFDMVYVLKSSSHVWLPEAKSIYLKGEISIDEEFKIFEHIWEL